MTITINVAGQTISCVFRKSKRAKRVSVRVYPDTSVIITVPQRIPYFFAQDFFYTNIQWIEKKVQEYTTSRISLSSSGTKEEYLQYKEVVRNIILEKIARYNAFYCFSYNRLSIRNQKTRWGSCSSDKNLNFNYQLYFLPERMIDYVVVHELCHLAELNHSQRFWQLVGQTIPAYKNIEKEMRHISVARTV
tara:strand:+ start:88 stop:660 length:573 start_codon:yes stop_codon:yes gene_type:complete